MLKYIAAFFAMTMPALAHDGAHLHPHGVEGWVVGLALMAGVGGVALAAQRVRKVRK